MKKIFHFCLSPSSSRDVKSRQKSRKEMKNFFIHIRKKLFFLFQFCRSEKENEREFFVVALYNEASLLIASTASIDLFCVVCRRQYLPNVPNVDSFSINGSIGRSNKRNKMAAFPFKRKAMMMKHTACPRAIH